MGHGRVTAAARASKERKKWLVLPNAMLTEEQKARFCTGPWKCGPGCARE